MYVYVQYTTVQKASNWEAMDWTGRMPRVETCPFDQCRPLTFWIKWLRTSHWRLLQLRFLLIFFSINSIDDKIVNLLFQTKKHVLWNGRTTAPVLPGAIGCAPELCGQTLCAFYEALLMGPQDVLCARQLAHPPAPSLVAWWLSLQPVLFAKKCAPRVGFGNPRSK